CVPWEDVRPHSVEPVVFDGHLGAFHRPARPTRAAVVLCSPVGRDGRCAYRPLWLFAEALAARGIPVLRYDHAGTGDSRGLDPEADQWERWLQGVEQAAVFARTYAGTRKLILCGLRL